MSETAVAPKSSPRPARGSSLIDTRIVYCGDCLDQLRKLPAGCVDLIYIDPPFNSNRNDEVVRSNLSDARPSGGDPHAHFGTPHAGTQDPTTSGTYHHRGHR